MLYIASVVMAMFLQHCTSLYSELGQPMQTTAAGLQQSRQLLRPDMPDVPACIEGGSVNTKPLQ